MRRPLLMGTRVAGSRPIAKPFGSTNSRSATSRPKKGNNLAPRQHGSAPPASVIWRIAWILALLTLPSIGNMDKDSSYGRKPRNSTRPTGLDHRDSARGGGRLRSARPGFFLAEPGSSLGFRLGRRWAGDFRPADLHPADRGCSVLL